MPRDAETLHELRNFREVAICTEKAPQERGGDLGGLEHEQSPLL
jgi:hypothetical protein